MQLESEAIMQRLLTFYIGCIVSQGVRVYHVLAAKYLYQLVEELAFLFLSSANRKQNFTAYY